MKKPAVILLALLGVGIVFIAGSWWGRARPTTPTSQRTQQRPASYTCPMHPDYRSDHAGDCPMCGMRLEPVRAADDDGAGTRGLVRINAERQQIIGVRVDEVRPASASRLTLRIPGRVAVDDQRVYRITAAVDGWIRQLGQNPAGSFVKKKQVLATYYAQNLISAAQTYVFALQTNAQAQSGDATIGYQRGSTTLSLLVALDSLRALGMNEFQIEEITKTRVAPSEVRVYSPINGFVIARGVSPEQRFDKGTEMYRISDISYVWVMAEVFEKDSSFLKPGTRATVLYEGRRLEARMSNALPQFDPQTRTLKTRFELDNPGDVLRPDMFVDVELHAEMPTAVTVPSDAVVDSGLRKTVYVDRGNGYFEPRRIETGWRMGDRVQITKGLMAGERVVISANFLLDSESRMKSAAMGLTNPETDPVCGMDVDRDAAKNAGRTAAHRDATYYFCSEDCKRKFQAAPGDYVEGVERTGSVAKAMNEAPVGSVKDLVCGMDVDRKDAVGAGRTMEHGGKTYYFCSDDCKKKFAANPRAYVK